MKKENPAKPRRVRLPNGSTLFSSWYVPEGRTVSGRVAAYKPTPLDRATFKQNEAEYKKTHTNYITAPDVPAYAVQKRLFIAPGSSGWWQTGDRGKVRVYGVISNGYCVAAYDYDADLWVMAKGRELANRIAAMLPPGVGLVWGDIVLTSGVVHHGYMACAAQRITKGGGTHA